MLPSACLPPCLSPGRGAGPPTVSRHEMSTVPACACVLCVRACVRACRSVHLIWMLLLRVLTGRIARDALQVWSSDGGGLSVYSWGNAAYTVHTHAHTHTQTHTHAEWGAYPRLTAVRAVREERAAATANAPVGPMSF